MKKKISELPLYSGSAAEFMVVGVDTTDSTTKKANFAALIGNSGDPRIKSISNHIPVVGDMLFYDTAKEEYCIVRQAAIGAVLNNYDTVRYETNYDTFVGAVDGYYHFVANNDAVQSNPLYSDDVAATSCFYRIEIDNTSAGSVTISAASGNASISETTITWAADDTMASIIAQFTALNASYITFGELSDGKGVGCEVGGYGANTMTASGDCILIDCSGLAMLSSNNPTVTIGGDYNPSAAYTYIGKGIHHNFRGNSAQSILGSACKEPSTTLIANDGYNYGYRVGLNYAKFRSWASVNGDNSFYDDGEGGSDDSVNHVMRESFFVENVIDGTGNSHVQGMYDYYTALLTDQSGDMAHLREEYISMYGNMTSMYDAYIMSHMIDIAALTGVTSLLRNYGFVQTRAKGDCVNINYNYKFIPAYPPEYNAQQYGKSGSSGFSKGVYYHPEPGDLGLALRDDIITVINSNIITVGVGTILSNSMYRGCVADCNSYGCWYFGGNGGVLDNISRSYGVFRCRPFLAFAIPS